MSEKSPAFQFYPKDVLSDGNAMAMPAEAFGIYMKLLCYDWIDNGLLAETKTWRRLGGFEYHDFQGNERNLEDWDIILSYIEPLFIPHPDKEGYVTNPRLLKERNNQKERSAKAQESANKRWDNKGKANAQRKQCLEDANALPTQCTSSSSSSSSSSSNINIKYKIDLPCIKLEQEQWDAWVLNFHHGNETAALEMCLAASDYRQGEGKGVPSECMAYLRQWFKRSLRFDQPKTIIPKHDKPSEAPRPQPKLYEPPPKPQVSNEAAKKFKEQIKKLVKKTSGEVTA